jgi:hypothetical protein
MGSVCLRADSSTEPALDSLDAKKTVRIAAKHSSLSRSSGIFAVLSSCEPRFRGAGGRRVTARRSPPQRRRSRATPRRPWRTGTLSALHRTPPTLRVRATVRHARRVTRRARAADDGADEPAAPSTPRQAPERMSGEPRNSVEMHAVAYSAVVAAPLAGRPSEQVQGHALARARVVDRNRARRGQERGLRSPGAAPAAPPHGMTRALIARAKVAAENQPDTLHKDGDDVAVCRSRAAPASRVPSIAISADGGAWEPQTKPSRSLISHS